MACHAFAHIGYKIGIIFYKSLKFVLRFFCNRETKFWMYYLINVACRDAHRDHAVHKKHDSTQ